MAALVECVPNISSSDPAIVELVAAPLQAGGDTWVLDQTSDVDHGRSVLTLAGRIEPLLDGMEAATEVAIGSIDMRRQQGRHPRIGAVDVVPFIPLTGATMDDCVAAAERFGGRIAERFGLPVYLYGEAARTPSRRVPAPIRRPGFEGLAAAMSEQDHRPDFGPRRPHPSAGATLVGARRFLIAFNIQLAGGDVSAARRIAARIRERDGGLAGVQALGIELPSLGYCQLSMNVLDHDRTPLWRVWEEAVRLAAGEDVQVVDSELVGLAPLDALIEVADHVGTPASASTESRVAEAGAWLRIRGFEPTMALELRLAEVRAG